MTIAVNQTRDAPVDELRSRLKYWLRQDAARLLWPRHCLVCGEPGLDGLDLCGPCAAQLPWNRSACSGCALPLAQAGLCGSCLRRRSPRRRRPPLDAVHAACLYASPVDRLLLRFKFHRDLAAGALLAQLMADAFAPLAPVTGVVAGAMPVLVPVPLHRARLRRRGYDQALELARPLSRALGLPLEEALLTRVRATGPQSELPAVQRRGNLRGAFGVPAAGRLPAHVVLVDDVMTTGATLQAAAQALRRAGVPRVDAWICARTP
ncbi:ComF family protein [Agrilutibacter solisilvae]|uniref:ComF family protein n=1 Tax=Agrilutibacter solisilvae TaxID=2763317 RepID=A0A975ATF3_9GAMM|nr:ComF family protein [Lysobacter solisilvae]QSX79223.1 ComF family protein [Lysobacter solisilvae]